MRVLVLAICMTLWPAAWSLAADDPDVAGIRLGMTPEQTKKALLAFGVAEKDIQEAKSQYNYTDGMKSLRTDPFLSQINAQIDVHKGGKRHTDTFNVFFSPPPSQPRVVALWRKVENRIDPSTVGQYQQSLFGKYGQPKGGRGSHTWSFPEGKLDCAGNTATTDPERLMGQVFNRSGGRYLTDSFRNRQVKSLEQCASHLIYRTGALPDRPATSVEAWMVDVHQRLATQIAAQEWVASLREKAIEARDAKGRAPKL